ncbi:MAG: hypothetical protein WDN01_01415 [Rhizomicrobium sp.]
MTSVPASEKTELWGRLDDETAVCLRRASAHEITTLHALIAREIGGKVASLPVMVRASEINRDSFWTIVRRRLRDGRDEIAGCYAFLFLNALGARAIETRSFDATDPPPEYLVPTGERPALVYMWAIVARKMLGVTFPMISQGFDSGPYGGLPVVGRAGSMGGLKALSAGAEAMDPPAIGTLFRIRSKAA